MTKTKRVRIAVAFNKDESPWVAPIFHDEPAADALERDFGPIEPPIRISIVEADVPLPEEPATVRGEVGDAN